ncbi:tRNA (adenosine(37)-N6)-threonylcarbamoyltransferase complex ATPase subunit type 1 TsaE [Puniceicoccus vermicola]|uniref:tRNA threonylcarbamoyladenosine biosynthesis protein TsaE n=1 Tax=Puniceicoccus vermicola TaxID=388746 RepID=A0A7X1B1T2_9BACT|nr:tRNA (adenosine(37)-N6)-threonylcarbamoyltransferase complex ATPase subunit type 1 TsaE [Puniceicoccus vermicola]MBC2604061.1 tRNA (adenosine(37)-N6)-threonylcarbamoyltransferase complex ATPase subunit type 1 TsaE [Puniceicoccus vermicola]
MNPDWKELEKGLLLTGEAETLAIGEWMGRTLAPNQTVSISGNLGNGKTTLSKGIAAGWGVTTTVKSPTYNYFLTYSSPRGQLVHLDAYRLSGPEEYDSLLIEDILEEPWLLLVEWPERVTNCLPLPNLQLKIESAGEHARRLSLLNPSPSHPSSQERSS